MRIDLRSPVTVQEAGGLTRAIDHVILREAKGRDLRKLDGIEDMKPFAQSMLLAEAVTGLDSTVIDEMGGNDIIAIAEAASGFLPQADTSASTETGGGAASSPMSPRS